MKTIQLGILKSGNQYLKGKYIEHQDVFINWLDLMVRDKNPILLDIQMWNEVSISLIQLRVYNGKVMLR